MAWPGDFIRIRPYLYNNNHMSCHYSCSTCSSSAFDACLTCPSGASLYASSCFCNSWSSDCAQTTAFKQVLIILDSFYAAMIPFVILFFCLKVRLPLTYRIFSVLQGVSLLIFCQHLYLRYEDFYILKILVKSNGYYSLPYRTSTQPIHFITPSIVLLGGFLIGLFGLYHPIREFTAQFDSFSSYIQSNLYPFLSNFYYFAVRGMAYYVGMWIQTVNTSPIGLTFFCLFSLILVLVSFKSLYDFHKGNFEEGVYQPQLVLYCQLSPLTFIGLPMISSTLLAVVIYCAPLALLLLIIILNKHYEVISKHKVGFYLVEIFGAGLAVGFLLAPDPARHYFLTMVLLVAVTIMFIEGAARFHSGFDLQRSSKIHPQAKSQIHSDQKEARQPLKKSKRAQYF